VQTLVADYDKKDEVYYTLTLIDEMLEDRSRVKLFRGLKSTNPFSKLLDLLAWQKDEYGVRLATRILAILHFPGLGFGEAIIDQNLYDLVLYVRDSLTSTEVTSITAQKHVDMLSCLMIFLRESETREKVNEKFKLHTHLSSFLDKAQKLGHVQLLYQVGFCLWLLSYDKNIAALMADTNVIPLMLKVMKSVSKEKVIRVCLACLRNLVDKAHNNQTMIENDGIKQLAVLRNRKWSDEEVVEDLEFVIDALARSVTVLSSIEIYRKEVLSGKLEWSPVHKSETFWRDNVTKICSPGKSVAESEDLL
jgi:V-type H+-transporting ATPase subunit H